jgi:division protein CdvB (Snf7/Vps24/ESCRT-III family)
MPDYPGDKKMVSDQKIRKYAKLQILNPEATKASLMQAAGIQHVRSSTIEKTPVYKEIRQQVQAAAEEVGVTPASIFSTLQRSMERNMFDDAHDTSANQAAKIAGEFIGMAAPVQVDQNINVQHTALVSILHHISEH